MNVMILIQNEQFFLPIGLRYLIPRLSDKDTLQIGIMKDKRFINKIGANSYQRLLREIAKVNINNNTHLLKRYFTIMMTHGRSIESVCQSYNTNMISIENDINPNTIIDQALEHNPDVIFFIDFPSYFPYDQNDDYENTYIFYTHNSLLPYYQGELPTFWALKEHETTTGISIYAAPKKNNHFNIIRQASIDINKGTTFTQLEYQVKILLMKNILTILDILNQDNNIKSLYLPNIKGNYHPFPRLLDLKKFISDGGIFF
ncbi:MAG: formyltransferase family protein [Hyphomicrobiales bacterium]